MRRSVLPEQQGTWSPKINFGAAPRFCAFDYEIRHEPGVVRVDGDASRWLPHVRAGVLAWVSRQRERGLHFDCFVVRIRNIRSHPIDTTPDACERAGFELMEALWRKAAHDELSEP